MVRRSGCRFGLLLAMVLAAVACGVDDSGEESGSRSVENGETRPPAASTAPAPTSTVATSTSEPVEPAGAGCADVVGVDVTESGGVFTFAATVRSDESGWDKYADRWEIRDREGNVLGVRELAHPHETEQPFTRSLPGVEIADPVSEVVVMAHDSVLGFCGNSMTVALPGR